MMNKFEVLLFDLGGVLADFRGFERLLEFIPKKVDIEDMKKRWLLSPSIKKFETGKSDTMEFASDFINEWALTMTPSQFIDEFSIWLQGPYEGALSLLYSLKADCL